MSQHEVVLLLGSNLGDKKKNILAATSHLENKVGKLLIKSEFLESEPVEFASFNNFYNFALILKTQLSPIKLLETIKKIERDLGRDKDSKSLGGFSDRIIDIDIVRYSGLKFKSGTLEIPHLKHLNEREFSKKILENLNFKYTNMKLSLLLACTLPIAVYSQDTVAVSTDQYPNTFTSGSANVNVFDNSSRKFNDWAISFGGGAAFMSHADLTSYYNKELNWGWNAYVSLDKQISHTFGLLLQYQTGKTNQRGQLPGAAGQRAGVADAWTKYNQISLLGDLNFSNLLRRTDNHSPYRWALHGYAGIGFQGYNTLLIDADSSRWFTNSQGKQTRIPVEIDQKLGIASFFYQAGLGLKYKISRRLDIEARTMYIMSGDEEFDGGGWTRSGAPQYNLINDTYSDNMWTVNLGFSVKLGKHISHLAWHDPLQEAYYRTNVLESSVKDLVVCKKGDADNDGVCDDWDRQLDTPAGARVDGSGVALDMDLDGIIDLYDKCVTVPGPAENNGCPTAPSLSVTIDEINKDFEGIEFALDKDIIRPQSFDKLDHAADVIKTLDQNSQFLVIGATDTRGSEAYNLNLSQRRANAVVKYLVGKGVPSGMLIAEGRGESDLKYPECNPATKCPEWKNEANRRVYFQQK